MDASGGLGGRSASVFGLFWHKQNTYALNMTQRLKGARQGDHALGACQNHTQFKPQIAPSGNFPM